MTDLGCWIRFRLLKLSFQGQEIQANHRLNCEVPLSTFDTWVEINFYVGVYLPDKFNLISGLDASKSERLKGQSNLIFDFLSLSRSSHIVSWATR